MSIAAVALTAAAGCSTPPAGTTVNDSAEVSSASSSIAPSATANPVAGSVEVAPITDIPWSTVGPGWVLTTWSPVVARRPGEPPAPGDADPETAPTTLYLVDPAGNRYEVTTLSGPDARLDLVDWSADGAKALFTSSEYPVPSTVMVIDLHSGARTTVAVDGTPRFARPGGDELLVSTSSLRNEPGTLRRIALDGSEQTSYPSENLGGAGRFSGSYLQSSDGTELVLGTANLGNDLVPRSDDSLVVVAADGTVLRVLPTPMADAECSPVRWWAPRVVLARCSAEDGSGTQLWRVPIDGAAPPTALTAVNSGNGDDPGFGSDLGDGIAWELPSGTYLQSAGACGTAFLSRLTPDGHTTRVDVPGMSQSVIVVGTVGDGLMLQGFVDCGGGTSLVSYDPAADTSTVLLGPPVNGGGVTEAIMFPEGS